MLYCVSLALSVSRLVFVKVFCFSLSLATGLLSLNSLFPSIYDIDGCATTAVSLVSGCFFFNVVTTGWIPLDQLM